MMKTYIIYTKFDRAKFKGKSLIASPDKSENMDLLQTKLESFDLKFNRLDTSGTFICKLDGELFEKINALDLVDTIYENRTHRLPKRS